MLCDTERCRYVRDIAGTGNAAGRLVVRRRLAPRLRSDTPLLEIFVRGTVMYLALFLVLRLVLKREAGAIGITDLLVVVLIADAAQNGLADDYSSIPDGLVLVGTIVFWSWGLDWLGFRFPLFQRLVHPAPLPLIRDGRLLRRNLEKEPITEGELMSQLRLQGVEKLEDVSAAYMEGDGRISVIQQNGSNRGARTVLECNVAGVSPSDCSPVNSPDFCKCRSAALDVAGTLVRLWFRVLLADTTAPGADWSGSARVSFVVTDDGQSDPRSAVNGDRSISSSSSSKANSRRTPTHQRHQATTRRLPAPR